MKHLGNLIEDQIIDFTFSTHAADGTPTSLAGNPAISVYKANSTVQTTEGVTLTVDFDSVTGLNHVRIDTSAHAFYATGNDYSVVITTGTVDGTSVVGTTLAVFSIENRYVEETPQTGDAYSPARYAQTAAMAAQATAEAVKTIVEPDGSGDLAAIKTQTDKFSFTGTDVKATLDGEEVTPTSASKTGYALTSEERTAIAAAIEADLIDDETHQAVMAAILAKLEAGFPDLDTLTLTAIASQVRTELATELARIDATISSRHASGAAVAKSPATLNWSADVSNPPTIPAIADIRNTSLCTGAFPAEVLANAPAGGEGGGLTEEQAAQLAAILDDTGTSGVKVADKAGYSLSGSTLSLGPTASRSKTDGYYTCPQGGTIGLYRRILGWDGDDLQQGDVSTITYSIFALSSDDLRARTAVDGHEDVSLATADVLFDSVQSDEWASNYNFRHIPDISENDAFAAAGTDYLVEYIITPASGQKIIERIRVSAT